MHKSRAEYAINLIAYQLTRLRNAGAPSYSGMSRTSGGYDKLLMVLYIFDIKRNIF